MLGACNTVGTIRLLFLPALTELQVAHGSRLGMYIFSY